MGGSLAVSRMHSQGHGFQSWSTSTILTLSLISHSTPQTSMSYVAMPRIINVYENDNIWGHSLSRSTSGINVEIILLYKSCDFVLVTCPKENSSPINIESDRVAWPYNIYMCGNAIIHCKKQETQFSHGAREAGGCKMKDGKHLKLSLHYYVISGCTVTSW